MPWRKIKQHNVMKRVRQRKTYYKASLLQNPLEVLSKFQVLQTKCSVRLVRSRMETGNISKCMSGMSHVKELQVM